MYSSPASGGRYVLAHMECASRTMSYRCLIYPALHLLTSDYSLSARNNILGGADLENETTQMRKWALAIFANSANQHLQLYTDGTLMASNSNVWAWGGGGGIAR